MSTFGCFAPYAKSLSRCPGEGPPLSLRLDFFTASGEGESPSPLNRVYHSPRIFHQGKPTPIQMMMLRKEISSPNFHQVFWST
jgi:hypothetical protein